MGSAGGAGATPRLMARRFLASMLRSCATRRCLVEGDMAAAMIVWLEWFWCRGIGVVVVSAAAWIVFGER